MVVTIKLIVIITKLTKKLFCIIYFKNIYKCDKFQISPHFLKSNRHPFIHTCKQAHTPPRINVNTNLLQKHFTTLHIEPPSHSYGVRLVL